MKLIALPLSSGKIQHYVNQTYVAYLREAGFTPFLISPDMTENLDDIIGVCHGLLLPGGVDIDPIYYGETNYGSRETEVDKDEFERLLLHRFVKAKLPVFGICRGFQLILRELMLLFPKIEEAGISYEQHLSNSHNAPGSLNVSRATPHHEVMSHNFLLWGEDKFNMYRKRFVNSMHHQGASIPQKVFLKKADKGLMINPIFGPLNVLAYTTYGADKDQIIIEAFQAEWNDIKVRAVQWHPEELKDVALLKNYFNEYNKVQTVEG